MPMHGFAPSVASAHRRRSLAFRLPFFLLIAVGAPHASNAVDPDRYRLHDPELAVVSIDRSPNESFLSVKADPAGRIFVGGREALFVYEPLPDGGYAARRELFRFPRDSWIYDIEFRGNDLYVLTLSALYVFRDGVVRRDAMRPERILWGLPDWHVHQAFHGLAWGLDGDLYLSLGDLLVWYGDFSRPDHFGHWTFFGGPRAERTAYTGVGGILRCRPDGSRLEVVAGGTRNSCGIAFDTFGNLFTNDNDHEGLPTEFVPGRLLHVVPQADFAWPRGWMAERAPGRSDLLETMVADLGRYVPVGQTYYDESYLPDRHRGNLFVARWGRRTLARYPIRARGASFAAEEITVLEGFDTTRPVGVAVGRGGRLFATLADMAHNEGSPVYPSELVMITRSDDAPTHPFKPRDLVAQSEDALYADVADGASWIARRAHLELLRRGGSALERAEQELGSSRDPAHAGRLLWLAAAFSAKADAAGREAFLDRLAPRIDSESPELGALAVRVAANFFADEPRSRALFLRAVRHPQARVRLAAIEGAFRATPSEGDPPFAEAIASGPALDADTYLRQLGTRWLAQRAGPDAVARLCGAPDAGSRLAGTLAAGFRLTAPEPTSALDASLPLQPWQSDDPYRVEYADGTVDLRELGRIGVFTTAEHWPIRALMPENERLFQMLVERLGDTDERVRLQSAHFLGLLKDPRSESTVAAVRRRSEREQLGQAPLTAVGHVWILGPFDDRSAGFATIHEPEQQPIDLNRAYGDGSFRWRKLAARTLFDFRAALGGTDGRSAYAYFRLESPRAQQVLLLPGSDDGIRVWVNGREVWRLDEARGGLPLQDIVFADLEPGTNEVLLRVRNHSGQHQLYLHYRSLSGSVSWSVPEPFDRAGLQERLRSADENARVPDELLAVDWTGDVDLGDAERGRRLFHEGLGCAKCHATRDSAVAGGPSLADAGSRFTIPYLVESILLPSHQVNPLFRSTQITTREGRVYVGLVVGETVDVVELLATDAERHRIEKKSIETRRLHDLSPMPAGLVRTVGELRDLLAYLAADRTK
ncbi:MAG: c-type cytochrome [Planctomycetes bacterium]|nr:c-type cytochrome [Planctomycetota bacterium]